jgi:N-acetylmuramoyl-L-alanine amidase
MKIVISSGHSTRCRGAAGPQPWGLDEVNEATRVVDRVATLLGSNCVAKFHDTVSTTQNENLNRIVSFHNSKSRELDVSVHFNAYQSTSKPMGTEVLWVTQQTLAGQVSNALASAQQLPNRGAKKRTDLYFLNNTNKPAILIETCFVDSQADAAAYRERFEQACVAIANALGATAPEPIPPEPEPEPPVEALFSDTGTCSWFGGPNDTGVSPSEGLAFIYSYDARPDLFLVSQPPGTTGLARRLNADGVNYVAVRWDYNRTPKTMLASKDHQALVRATKTGKEFLAWPADWGPNTNTGRVADLSPALLNALGIKTDDEVTVIYPAPEEPTPEPEPEPENAVDITINIRGHVKVTVNGVVMEVEAP